MNIKKIVKEEVDVFYNDSTAEYPQAQLPRFGDRLNSIGINDDMIDEETITPPDIPNTMNFWHGGNLENYNEVIAQKNGRYEYGAGLYLTTHYNTAVKYSKGSRKLYLVTVENGVDIEKSFLDVEKVKNFIDTYVIGRMRKMVWERLEKYIDGNNVKAYVFNNIILNEKAIKSTNTRYLRSFFVENGIDYNIVNNAFGWGEMMMVLYNMKKIVNIIQIKPKDKIEVYDLH